MSDGDGPYLFDVGVVALAHAGTPVSDAALSWIRRGIRGEIDAIVPYPAVVGAEIVLSNYYGFSHAEASRLMTNFMDAKRIHWYEEIPEPVVRDGFDLAGELNIDGWDGYYAGVAIDEGAGTILTLDEDFEDLAAVSTTVVLSREEFDVLADFLDG